MQPKADSGFRCTTFRYLVDPKRDVDVPVGVALWNPESRWLRFRLPAEGERIEDVASPAANAYLLATKAQIEGWLRRGELPYASGDLHPLGDAWWEQVQRLLRFSIRLGPVQPVDCQHPDQEIETLYEALVQPKRSVQERRTRIDGAVRRALGSLAKRFRSSVDIPGFRGRPVKVLRAASGPHHTVVVEAVNLALRTAEHDADALASRLARAREGAAGTEVRFVLGYLASPGGLNGERVMKEWVETRLGARMFDLEREESAFHHAAATATDDVGDSLGVLAPAR